MTQMFETKTYITVERVIKLHVYTTSNRNTWKIILINIDRQMKINRYGHLTINVNSFENKKDLTKNNYES